MKQPTILLLAGGVVAGALIGSFLPLGVTMGAMALIIVWRPSAWPLVLGLGLIALRLALHPLAPPAGDIGRDVGRSGTFQGTIVSAPVDKDDGKRQLVVDVAGAPSGKLLVTTTGRGTVKPGDQVTVSGRLVRPPRFRDFDYRAYLAKDAIYATMPQGRLASVVPRTTVLGAAYQIRVAASEQASRLFPPQAAAFLMGILAGERHGLSEQTAHDFQRTGLTHVLALSGYNVSIVLAVMLAIFGRRRFGIAAGLVVLAAFVAIAGPSASVLRAALMGGFIVLAQTFGRPQSARRACLISAAILLLTSPWSLRYDLGFDLSFLATLGILWFEPAFRRRFQRLPKVIAETLAATAAATLLTMPLIVWSFGIVSLVSPLANLLIVPLIPWLMLGGFAAVVVGGLSPGLAGLIAGPVGWLTTLVLSIVHTLAELPFAALVLDHGKHTVAAALALAITGGVTMVVYRSYSWGKSPVASASAAAGSAGAATAS